MFYYRIYQEIIGNHRKCPQYDCKVQPQGHIIIIARDKALYKACGYKERHRSKEQR